MATEVKLPRLGQGMESGTIVRWLKAEGDAVKANEPLYELDTDKVTQEVESEVAGVLLRIVVQEGETEVGTTIAVIGNDSTDVTVEDSADRRRGAQAGPPRRPQRPQHPLPRRRSRQVTAPPPSTWHRRPAPGSRRRLWRAGSRGSGGSSSRRSQVPGLTAGSSPRTWSARPVGGAPAAAPAPLAPPSADVEVIQLSTIRKTIARRLTEAWTAPVFQLGVSIDMSETLHLREQLVARLAEGDAKPTVNDLLTKFVGVALMQHRALNATFTGDEIQRHPGAHVGMAVAAPNGLVVPVIRDADRRSVQEIARARADLVSRARDGKLTLPDMEGGTFTISNLGMFGIEQFVAVLNPPQVAILAVGAVKETPVVVDGAIDIAPMMQVVLTCDHRAIDGADGAEFLRTLVALVEQPALAL